LQRQQKCPISSLRIRFVKKLAMNMICIASLPKGSLRDLL
jgi:hypothetical protein